MGFLKVVFVLLKFIFYPCVSNFHNFDRNLFLKSLQYQYFFFLETCTNGEV